MRVCFSENGQQIDKQCLNSENYLRYALWQKYSHKIFALINRFGSWVFIRKPITKTFTMHPNQLNEMYVHLFYFLSQIWICIIAYKFI